MEDRIVYMKPCPEIIKRETCFKCNNTIDLEKELQYSCLFCEHTHCGECESKSLENKGTLSLAHPHILYKILPRSSGFDFARWGKNVFKQPREFTERP